MAQTSSKHSVDLAVQPASIEANKTNITYQPVRNGQRSTQNRRKKRVQRTLPKTAICKLNLKHY